MAHAGLPSAAYSRGSIANALKRKEEEREPAFEEDPLLGGEENKVKKKTHHRKQKVEPEESVYSAILILPCIAGIKGMQGYHDRSSRLAVMLCVVNAILQVGVVRVLNIYDYSDGLADDRTLIPIRQVVSDGDTFWSQKEKAFEEHVRRRSEEVHVAFLGPPDSNERAELMSAKGIQPLCRRVGEGNGTFTCLPYSVRFAYEWGNLDTNGDGIWTLTEAKKDLANLKGIYDISPETIFNNLINGLRMQADFLENKGNDSLYLSRDVTEERAIPKAYFDFWQGDAMMCSFFDPDSCEAAAKAGVFESALRSGRLSPRAKGIYDLDSAITYCYRMLQPGGVCEAALPTDFKRNREQRWERCGTRELIEGGRYENPYSAGQVVHILEASYTSVSTYKRCTSYMYVFFLSLIVMLWLWSLIQEVKDLIKTGEFLLLFGGLDENRCGGQRIDKEVADPAEDDDNDSGYQYQIWGISMSHRLVLVVIYLMRVLVCIILTTFGTTFLLGEEDYLDLVMNSLALTFILEIDSILFALVERDVSAEMQRCKALTFQSRLPYEGMFGYALKKECW
eukprot:CAMPEP_0169104900 /NCGR_PEP_ID=MMETSP1015-20121227/23507_1 /TAXON_ID=342587 /ORGANISM="Karlodinium micrum, Strain CCMP2283" /LENGTH=564 /DNA_ID=CAMNT_0009166219 /DNA_START=62 /DNA_END=1753 /DNA_ORIENTATION=+